MQVRALVARDAHATTRVGSLELKHSLDVEEVGLGGPGPGEVLVEVTAAGLCHSDVSVLTGDRPRPLPMVLGHEATGFVRELGDGVRRVAVDEQVVMTFVGPCGECLQCQRGRPALCARANAANRNGTLPSGRRPFTDAAGKALNHHLGVSGFSTWTVVAEESVVPVHTAQRPELLAVLGCAVLTGVGAVLNTARVVPGESVAIMGCGGVGLAAVLGARLAGASPIIAVDPVPQRLTRARHMGADVCIEWHPKVMEEIRDLTNGGADFAFEAAGRLEPLNAAYAATAPGGTTVVVGLAHPAVRFQVNPSELVGTEKRICGSYMGSSVPSRDIPRLIRLVDAARLPLEQLIGGTYSLEDAGSALRALAEGVEGRQIFMTQHSTEPRSRAGAQPAAASAE